MEWSIEEIWDKGMFCNLILALVLLLLGFLDRDTFFIGILIVIFIVMWSIFLKLCQIILILSKKSEHNFKVHR